MTPDEGPSLETSKFSLYFSGSCIPTNESLFILLTLPTLVQAVHNYESRLNLNLPWYTAPVPKIRRSIMLLQCSMGWP